MKQFFKFMFASILGVIIGMVLLTFIGIGIVTAVVGSGDSKTTDTKPNSILKLDLNYEITERTGKNPFEKLDFSGSENAKSTGLNDILKSIRYAATDDQIKGIYIPMSVSLNRYGTLEEIRDALIEFKKSKKFIIAYGEFCEENSYYTASVADKIYLNPSGEMLFDGFSSNHTYLKGLFDKMGLEAQLIRHGKYKAAGEPFIADKMSPENREQIRSYVGSLYDHFITKIAEARKLNKQEVFEIANQLKIQSASDAKALKMIDDLYYEDQVMDELKKLSGVEDKKEINFISLSSYAKRAKDNSKITVKDKIAIVYANGEIMSGEGSDDEVGSDRIAGALRKAKKDSSIKAVVLRVNSPGGSVIASDVIWREVVLTKKVKPVIVSFGAVAASGGYYISAPADVIVAEPNTITGSIGVFGMLINAQKLVNEKLGIKVEKVKFGEFSDMGSVDRPLTNNEKAVIQKMVDRVYVDFVQRVSEGRNLTPEKVDSIAQGRVWSGIDAKKLGLVDEIGGIDKAIEIALERANLSEYRIVSLPEQKDPIEQLMKSFGEDASLYFAKRELGEHYQYLLQVKKAAKYQGIQARMPFDIRID